MAYLILDITVAEFKTQEILKGLEERLVEVKMGKLELVVEQCCHGIVDALYRLFRNTSILVTSGFHEMWS